MIKEVKKYTDDEGRSVTAYIPILFDHNGTEGGIIRKNQDELVAYEGQVGIQTPMGVAPIRFPFPQDYTLEKCYEKFEDIATVEANKVIKEAEEKRKEEEEVKKAEENLIVTPRQMRQKGDIINFPRRW